ncbi:hypothetical protein ACIPVB_02485 [Microbacterium sp. NPDC090007]|uniref:hypothetical protein n=1 Tax=Microbacterium sp. NPDC090007 TaxID=3364204 RepID=UPI003821CE97
MQYNLCDNTVPINFALIRRTDLLRSLLDGRGAWTGAVQAECEDSIATGLYPGLEEVPGLIAHTWIADDGEQAQARRIRREIRRPDEPFLKSYGEAESLAVFTNRGLKGVFLTDDRGARRYVEDRALTVAVVSTAELLAIAVNLKLLRAHEGAEYIVTLMKAQRGVRLDDYEAALENEAF